ncbi:MAG: hypothetical protein JST22_16725 [Bacteroidetes bacterium]|nr:hypothetical protein [Bacteroidota bacterium]
MTRVLLALLVAAVMSTGIVYAQNDDNETPAAAAPTPEELKEAVDGLGDRLTTVETDVDKLKQIKISGYVQAEWQFFDQTTNPNGRAVFSDSRRNFFTIRRGRLKVQHKLGDMSYVLQGDFTEGGFKMKDAYITYNLAGEQLGLTAGVFNRPNYEVELSSSARESAERAQVTRAFYPDERDLGFMFTYQPPISQDFTPKLQVGLFNGPGVVVPEADAYKDLITRLTFPVPFGADAPIQADLGASLYYGGIPQTGDSIVKWDGEVKKTVANDATGNLRGMGNKMNFNVEGQIYLDLLPFGGTILKGEFMGGKRPTAASAATAATVGTKKDINGKDSVVVIPGAAAGNLQIRNQSGFYAYFVQNIGSSLQFALKYDTFDRNTDLSGANVKSASDASTSILGLGFNYFFGNIRLTLWYEIPTIAKDEVVAGMDDLKDNKTTIRLQYKY